MSSQEMAIEVIGKLRDESFLELTLTNLATRHNTLGLRDHDR
jgi:hypothetical protein